jgi:DNA-directed RNA polymerase alpha subunit
MPNPSEQPDRNTEIVQAKKNGETLDSLAKRYGLTRDRVRQIIENSEKPEERGSGPFKGLPPRIVKALQHSGINSLEEAQKLSEAELAGVKNVGPDMARKIKEWKA